MKENFKLFGIITFAVIISLMTAGCSDKDADDGTSKLTGTVTIQGTAQAGQMITANTNNLGGSGTIRYQWKRGDTSSAAGTNISSAVSSTYLLASADVGKYIKLTVTRADNSGSVTSAAAIGPVWVDSTSSLTSADTTSTTVTDGSRTGVLKIDISKLPSNNNWAVAQYSLSAYKDQKITITFSADVKREGAAGTLAWKINNDSDYPTVATQNNATAGTWYSINGTWTGTPTDTNPALYLNNDKTANTTFYYIDNFTITIVVDVPAFTGFTGTTLTISSKDQETLKSNGYDYELWSQEKKGPTTMTLGVGGGGTFKCDWSNGINVLARAGRKYNETQTHAEIGTISIEFTAAKFTVSGDVGYLSCYGWITNGAGGGSTNLVEYYIVENYNSYNPGSAGTAKGSATIDGATYTFYERAMSNAPSIKAGSDNFTQYLSVRAAGSKRSSGTISVSEHFKAWNNAGMTKVNGKMYEVSLKVEGWNGSNSSTASAEITKNILKINDIPIK